MKVKVILKEDIKGVGKKNEIVTVKDGYANNFLLNTNKGVLATPENIKKLEDMKNKKERNLNNEIKKANSEKEILESKEIELFVKTGANGKIFGSINSKEISDEIKKIFNLDIDKKKINVSNKVKELGIHTVEIKLFSDIKANLKINIKSL